MDSFISEPRRWSRDDVALLLTSKTALTDLDIHAARKVVQRMVAKRFKAGTILFQEGLANTGFMMMVLRGEAVVEQENLKKTDSLILSVVGPGSVLGEMGLLDGEPRSATCTAFTEMDVAVLEREALAEMIVDDSATASKLLALLLKRVSERLRSANKKLRSLTQINQALQGQLPGSGDDFHVAFENTQGT